MVQEEAVTMLQPQGQPEEKQLLEIEDLRRDQEIPTGISEPLRMNIIAQEAGYLTAPQIQDTEIPDLQLLQGLVQEPG